MVRFKVDEDSFALADHVLNFHAKWNPWLVGFEDGQIWKSVKAVVPVDVGVTLVNAPPPAEYEPELATSLVLVYAVVAAVKDALLSYKASLNSLPVPVVKLCTPFISSTLKLVHM